MADGTPIFFPKPQVLEETECDHRQQNVMVQSMPVPALTMIEPQLFLHLLVPLLTACLDGSHQLDEGGLSRMIGHVEFALIGAPLTNQPDLGPRQVATRAHSQSIGQPDAHGGEVAPHAPLVPARHDTRWMVFSGWVAMKSAAERLSTDQPGFVAGRPRVRRGGGSRDTSVG